MMRLGSGALVGALVLGPVVVASPAWASSVLAGDRGLGTDSVGIVVVPGEDEEWMMDEYGDSDEYADLHGFDEDEVDRSDLVRDGGFAVEIDEDGNILSDDVVIENPDGQDIMPVMGDLGGEGDHGVEFEVEQDPHAPVEIEPIHEDVPLSDMDLEPEPAVDDSASGLPSWGVPAMIVGTIAVGAGALVALARKRIDDPGSDDSSE